MKPKFLTFFFSKTVWRVNNFLKLSWPSYARAGGGSRAMPLNNKAKMDFELYAKLNVRKLFAFTTSYSRGRETHYFKRVFARLLRPQLWSWYSLVGLRWPFLRAKIQYFNFSLLGGAQLNYAAIRNFNQNLFFVKNAGLFSAGFEPLLYEFNAYHISAFSTKSRCGGFCALAPVSCSFLRTGLSGRLIFSTYYKTSVGAYSLLNMKNVNRFVSSNSFVSLSFLGKKELKKKFSDLIVHFAHYNRYSNHLLWRNNYVELFITYLHRFNPVPVFAFGIATHIALKLLLSSCYRKFNSRAVNFWRVQFNYNFSALPISGCYRPGPRPLPQPLPWPDDKPAEVVPEARPEHKRLDIELVKSLEIIPTFNPEKHLWAIPSHGDYEWSSKSAEEYTASFSSKALFPGTLEAKLIAQARGGLGVFAPSRVNLLAELLKQKTNGWTPFLNTLMVEVVEQVTGGRNRTPLLYALVEELVARAKAKRYLTPSRDALVAELFTREKVGKVFTPFLNDLSRELSAQTSAGRRLSPFLNVLASELAREAGSFSNPEEYARFFQSHETERRLAFLSPKEYARAVLPQHKYERLFLDPEEYAKSFLGPKEYIQSKQLLEEAERVSQLPEEAERVSQLSKEYAALLPFETLPAGTLTAELVVQARGDPNLREPAWALPSAEEYIVALPFEALTPGTQAVKLIARARGGWGFTPSSDTQAAKEIKWANGDFGAISYSAAFPETKTKKRIKKAAYRYAYPEGFIGSGFPGKKNSVLSEATRDLVLPTPDIYKSILEELQKFYSESFRDALLKGYRASYEVFHTKERWTLPSMDEFMQVINSLDDSYLYGEPGEADGFLMMRGIDGPVHLNHSGWILWGRETPFAPDYLFDWHKELCAASEKRLLWEQEVSYKGRTVDELYRAHGLRIKKINFFIHLWWGHSRQYYMATDFDDEWYLWYNDRFRQKAKNEKDRTARHKKRQEKIDKEVKDAEHSVKHPVKLLTEFPVKHPVKHPAYFMVTDPFYFAEASRRARLKFKPATDLRHLCGVMFGWFFFGGAFLAKQNKSILTNYLESLLLLSFNILLINHCSANVAADRMSWFKTRGAVAAGRVAYLHDKQSPYLTIGAFLTFLFNRKLRLRGVKIKKINSVVQQRTNAGGILDLDFLRLFIDKHILADYATYNFSLRAFFKSEGLGHSENFLTSGVIFASSNSLGLSPLKVKPPLLGLSCNNLTAVSSSSLWRLLTGEQIDKANFRGFKNDASFLNNASLFWSVFGLSLNHLNFFSLLSPSLVFSAKLGIPGPVAALRVPFHVHFEFDEEWFKSSANDILFDTFSDFLLERPHCLAPQNTHNRIIADGLYALSSDRFNVTSLFDFVDTESSYFFNSFDSVSLDVHMFSQALSGSAGAMGGPTFTRFYGLTKRRFVRANIHHHSYSKSWTDNVIWQTIEHSFKLLH